MTDRLSGVVHVLDEAEYHSHPALSSTGARKLLESPATFHYWTQHPTENKPEFDLGSAVHHKVLGTGWPLEIIDAPDWRTKAAREARDDARAEGRIPVLKSDLAEVDAMAEAVLSHPTARAFLEVDGHAEDSVFSVDPATGVETRARFDFLPTDFVKYPAVDLKTTAGKADAAGFAKSAASYGYDVQQGFYEETHANAVGGGLRGMVFVVVEKAPPYLVAVHQLTREFVDMGVTKARKARELYAECSASGVWPGYSHDVQLVAAPVWLLYDYTDKYGDE